MNATELYVEASEAIHMWRIHNNGPCVLYIKDGKVCCWAADKTNWINKPTLYVTSYECTNGMKQTRWNQIGTELLNLYNKKKACQKNAGK